MIYVGYFFAISAVGNALAYIVRKSSYSLFTAGLAASIAVAIFATR